MKKPFWLYVLKSKDKISFIGITEDIYYCMCKLRQTNQSLKCNNLYLAYLEKFSNYREARLKKLLLEYKTPINF